MSAVLTRAAEAALDAALVEARDALWRLVDAYHEHCGLDPEGAADTAAWYARKCAEHHMCQMIGPVRP